MSFNMYIPTRILFGAGQLNQLGNQKLPGKKALLVISQGKSTRQNGYLDRVIGQLGMAGVGYALFDRIEANPRTSTVMAGAAAARSNQCDLVVALGGGSVIDASKVIAFMATNEGDCWDYARGGTGKGKPIAKKPLPVIAITTTAGTGSEVDAWGVINNEETREKIGIGGIDELFPVLAIVDPELMTTVPPSFTAYQGFDAFFHSAEGYISKFANLMSDMYAITAIENVSRNLAAAVRDGKDLEARERVAFGNTLSGVVMCVGAVTSQHSLEHAMSAYHPDLPHGAGLVMISKAFFGHFIARHVCDERFVRMAQAMGRPDAREPEEFIEMLDMLQRDCGVAELKMSDYGIRPDEFERMARNAMETMGGLFQCDRATLSVADCVAIYAASYK